MKYLHNNSVCMEFIKNSFISGGSIGMVQVLKFEQFTMASEIVATVLQITIAVLTVIYFGGKIHEQINKVKKSKK